MTPTLPVPPTPTPPTLRLMQLTPTQTQCPTRPEMEIPQRNKMPLAMILMLQAMTVSKRRPYRLGAPRSL